MTIWMIVTLTLLSFCWFDYDGLCHAELRQNEITSVQNLSYDFIATTDSTQNYDKPELGAMEEGSNNSQVKFPPSIVLDFEFNDQQYHFDLQLASKLLAPNILASSTSSEQTATNIQLTSYRTSSMPNGQWAVATLHPDKSISITFHVTGNTTHIRPAKFCDMWFKDQSHQIGACQANSVAFTFENVTNFRENESCGFIFSNGTSQLDIFDVDYSKDQASDIAKLQSLIDQRQASRKLLQISNDANSVFYSKIDRWTPSCFANDNQLNLISIGVMIDYSVYKTFNGNYAEIYAAIQHMYANINMIYKKQMNIQFQIYDIVVASQITSDNAAWNFALSDQNDPSSCIASANGINDQLYQFSRWLGKNQPKKYAIWNLITNCWPITNKPTTVGLAWIGSACSSDYKAGVISLTSTSWITIAHEISHLLGGLHTFQQGQGKTGGLMDYGLPSLNGAIQFNTKYSKQQICDGINKMKNAQSSFVPYCVKAVTGTCGNGVVEVGEECDETTPCCNSRTCKLTVGAECAWTFGAGRSTECCNVQCKIEPTTTLCQSRTGYCNNGKCQISTCNYEPGLSFCNINAYNKCKQLCRNNSNGSCFETRRYSVDSNIEEGAICDRSPLSKCVTDYSARETRCVPI